jgi:hypothetical protein
VTTLRFASTGPETFVEFRGRELVRAEVNGVALDPRAWRDGRITLAGLAADNVLTVAGRMAYRSDGEGLHRHVDPNDGQAYLYAMSFLDAGPWWFAGFDQPTSRPHTPSTSGCRRAGPCWATAQPLGRSGPLDGRGRRSAAHLPWSRWLPDRTPR